MCVCDVWVLGADPLRFVELHIPYINIMWPQRISTTLFLEELATRRKCVTFRLPSFGFYQDALILYDPNSNAYTEFIKFGASMESRRFRTGQRNILLSSPKTPRLHAHSRLYEFGV